MTTTIFLQQIFHVFKKLHMPSLVTGDGNALHIFLNSRFYNFLYRPVVTKMDDLGAFALHDAPHNINSSIMTIEEAGRRNNTNLISGSITHIGKNPQI